MRSRDIFFNEYEKHTLLRKQPKKNNNGNKVSYDRGFAAFKQSVMLTDLCLHFLHKHAGKLGVRRMHKPTDIIPYLLQGPLIPWMPDGQTAKELSTLRQYAGDYRSRVAWQNALELHGQHAQTAYVTHTGSRGRQHIRRSEFSSERMTEILNTTLRETAEYKPKELQWAFADPDVDTYFVLKRYHDTGRAFAGQAIIPDIVTPDNDKRISIDSYRRCVNTPVTFIMDELYDLAKEADERESLPDFPPDMSKLNLLPRIKKVDIESLDGEFYKNNTVTLDGVKHVVGMLSSGKTTLSYALIFALAKMNKHTLIFTQSTAEAQAIVRRLRFHGISATGISSPRNRTDQTRAVYKSARNLYPDTILKAAAELVQGMGTACPLESFQELYNEKQGLDSLWNFKERPCHSLIQSAKADPEQDTSEDTTSELDIANRRQARMTCPLIQACPAHIQQRHLTEIEKTDVIVMTPAAFIDMVPDEAFVSEDMPFPELFQYLIDVVIIDEADSMQNQFDDRYTEEASALQFINTTKSGVLESVTEANGMQYKDDFLSKWEDILDDFNKSTRAIYNIITQSSDIKWLADRERFTAASIFMDLLSTPAGSIDPKDLEKLSEYRNKVATMASMLRGSVRQDYRETNQEDGDSVDFKAMLGPDLRMAYDFLQPKQANILYDVVYNKKRTLGDIEATIKNGCLKMFACNSPKNKKQPDDDHPEVPTSTEGRAHAIIMALLANVCLSKFSYIVHTIPAVQDDFDIGNRKDRLNNIMRKIRNYGNLIPQPLFGDSFGLIFDPVEGKTENGGNLQPASHLGVGRSLLTNMHNMLALEGRAGPHVLLMSGTSWAGGNSRSASAKYDVQCPAAAILKQPAKEIEALSYSEYAIVSPRGKNHPFKISGTPPNERPGKLADLAKAFIDIRIADENGNNSGKQTSFLDAVQHECFKKWDKHGLNIKDRRRTLLVTNNYDDAVVAANAVAFEARGRHTIHCLVKDDDEDNHKNQHIGARKRPTCNKNVIPIPRANVERFGLSPENSILVAPIGPISRGHNIVNADGMAAISFIFFLHRPHPRPDDYSTIVGMLNRTAMDITLKRINPPDSYSPSSLTDLTKWYKESCSKAIDEGFAMRVPFTQMPTDAKEQYAWDLITSLWQTIGRGIRGGAPIYVGFADEQFAPEFYDDEEITPYNSCLKQCHKVLSHAMESGVDSKTAEILYRPFLEPLNRMFDEITARLRDKQTQG